MSTLFRYLGAASLVKQRRVFSIVWIFISLLLFARPFRDLVGLSLSSDDFSYVIVVPFISIGVLFFERRQLPISTSPDKIVGASFLFFSGVTALLAHSSQAVSVSHLQLSAYILSLILFWAAGFTFLYGRAAMRTARFPFLFLLLTIPLPDFLLEHVTYALQAGSAWVTGALFEIFGVPFLREGFVFHLATVNIEVAKECSGIRSSTALLVLALLIAHFQLKFFRTKLMFLICGLFMMVLKNGIRIATLTLLAMYVDPSFLFGRLHQQGGVIFFLLGLLLLLPILILLKRWESGWLRRPNVQRLSSGFR